MQLASIRLRDFRNHTDTTLEFGEGINVILGDNGQGKTNILEAVSYLCLTKSFYASHDTVVISLGKESFDIEGVVVSDAQVENHVRVAYQAASREKVYTINKRRIEPLSSVIGRFPIIILSPEHTPITFGPPSSRRRFVDMLLSQSSRAYFEDLLEYRHILKQRNKTLLDARLTRSDPGPLLEAWTGQIVEVGARIMNKRRQFVEQFGPFISSSYHAIVGGAEEPTINYIPAVRPGNEMVGGESANLTKEEFADRLQKEIREKSRDEARLGTTLVGPHRDDFALKINDLDLRKFASQGQHKTFLIALKVGEFFFLKEQRGETPIFLLDDAFSELDEHRARGVLELLAGLSQTFITSTNSGSFDGTTPFGDDNRKFFVSNGTVVYESV